MCGRGYRRAQLVIGDAGGDDDGATTHVQSRRTVIDWTSLREGDVIFSSARQETHQGIEKKIFLALIDSLFLLIFLRESSRCGEFKNSTSEVLLASSTLKPCKNCFFFLKTPSFFAAAGLSQYAAKRVDLDVDFASTIR